MFETFDDELIARITDITVPWQQSRQVRQDAMDDLGILFCQEKRSYKKDSKIIVQGQRIVPRGQKPIAGQTVPAELFIVLSLLCMHWHGKTLSRKQDQRTCNRFVGACKHQKHPK